MNCEKCGSENRDEANYCYYCGQAFPHMQSETQDAVAVPEVATPPPLRIDETTTEEQFGHILGARYELKEMLGRGGMGVVYRAYDSRLKMNIAVKFLLDRYVNDADAVESLRIEAKAAMLLAHPNIIRLYNFEDTPEAKYVLMEYIKGESLASIGARKPDRLFEESDVIKYISKTCDALIYAHKQGIVHRDIKPANIIITSDDQVKLADFGIAHIQEVATSKANGGGTPVYMSPEQILNMETDARSDIYSLGITIYEMLAGRPPFRGTDVRDKHIHGTPEKMEGVTDWMNFIVLKCLRKEPDGRWTSAQELKDVLTRKKEIEVGFQTKFRPAWAWSADEKKKALPKEPVPEPRDNEMKMPARERRIIEKTSSPSRSSSSYRISRPMPGRHTKPTHLAPEREQARMGFGTLAGILAGIMFVAMNKSISPEGTNTALFQFGWIFYGGFIGISIGIAQQRATKGLLSCILGFTGGLGAALIARLASGFPSIENLTTVPYCLLCGAVIGALIGIADGFYEMSFSYSARCLAWGALGGILAIAAFVVIRVVFSSFWKPYFDWLVMGGALGFFINMCIGSVEKPLNKSALVFREL